MSKVREKLNMSGFRGPNAPQTTGRSRSFRWQSDSSSAAACSSLPAELISTRSLIPALSPASAFTCRKVVLVIKKGRQDNIFYGLPDALDLMVVCVEAGLGLDQAMRKVTEEMKKTYKVISEEFARAICNCRWGGARTEVLHDCAELASTT